MTKENCKKLLEHYKEIGRKDLVEDLKKSYKNSYGEELEKEAQKKTSNSK